MRTMRKYPWIACAALVLLLAGCSSQPADVQITPVGSPSAAKAASPESSPRAMPSYPILLVDLPRYDAGQSVPPARSRTSTIAERDIDSRPPSSAYVAPVAARPLAAPSASVRAGSAPPIASPPVAARAVAPKKPEAIDLRYVP